MQEFISNLVCAVGLTIIVFNDVFESILIRIHIYFFNRLLPLFLLIIRKVLLSKSSPGLSGSLAGGPPGLDLADHLVGLEHLLDLRVHLLLLALPPAGG